MINCIFCNSFLEEKTFFHKICYNHNDLQIDFTFSPFENEEDEIIFINIYCNNICFRYCDNDRKSLLVFLVETELNGRKKINMKMFDKINFKENPLNDFLKLKLLIKNYTTYS